MDFTKVVTSRRSIRKYTDQVVDQDKIIRIVEAARLAPSWKNLQCWRILVVDDKDKKELLIDAFEDTNPGKKAIAQAPVLIVVFADPQASGVVGDKQYYLVDIGICMEHMVLAAQAEGLGTCWLGLFDEDKVRAALDVPEQLVPVAMTPLGYPNQEPKPRPRKELNEIAFKNSFGQTLE
ncbi:nitroreductase [Desulfitispora alkaliphila]|uniref:nitroreductase family protein n=1 Tax=Desulfitispora alkaliphila TaxID=622674 RepID=UPI003D1B0ED0